MSISSGMAYGFEFATATCWFSPKMGFRRDFEGTGCTPAAKCEFKCRVAASFIGTTRFDELPVQTLAPETVRDAEAPALVVREHAVDPI